MTTIPKSLPKASPPTGGERRSSTTSQTRVEVTETAKVKQTARLEGTYQADLIHDVLVRAGANVTGSSTNVQMSDPKLLGSEVTKTKDGKIVVEDTIELTLTIKSRRELEAFALLLDRARVENGQLTMKPTHHDVQVTTEQGSSS